MTLPHTLDRTVFIEAPRATVFRFFTDSTRWASWWGAGSTIDARAGGAAYIRHPNGIEVSGEVLEVTPPERIVFTYGFASGKPIPPGASRVTIALEARESGTMLRLRHEFPEESVRNEHVQGWRFQLSLFGNLVANEVHSDAAAIVDGWYTAWTIANDAARREALAKIAVDQVSFRDQYSLLEGVDELSSHIAAALRFMPGVRLERRGAVRQCQGTALAPWAAVGPDGNEMMTGTSVFRLGSDGRIVSAVGIAG